MKLAVVGNRVGYTKQEVYKEIDNYALIGTDFIITGGASGVDTFAMEYAKEHGIGLIVLYPDIDIPNPDRYFERNYRIVLQCDGVLAFNKKDRSGTKHTINIALRLNKKVRIC